MTLKNLFSDIPSTFDDELTDVLLQSKKITIERIVSYGQTSPKTGWYDQTQNEWVVILKGEAIIKFEDKAITLQVGSYLNIPAHTKHKVSWTSDKCEIIWLAIFY